MRNMSFALTKEQFLDGTKTVTRRLGWDSLIPGDLVMACEKCMGLKRGEKIKKLGVIEIMDVRPVRLNQITKDEVVREGFPEMSPSEFVDMFCDKMKVWPAIMVNRIEFRRVPRED